MRTITLTRHFKKRCLERVDGPPPSEEELEHYIHESVLLLRHRDVRTPHGKLLYRALAMYWNPAMDIVIKVDALNKTAVTVLSPKLLEDRNGK